ncbi:ECF-type sigma factor [Sphingomonas sp. CJ99]
MADKPDAQHLAPLLYGDLRRLAARHRWQYGSGETLRSTALVSEAFLRLRQVAEFADERHFLRTAAIAMRQVQVNHAHARMTAKRGGGATLVPVDDDLPVFWESDERLLALNDALARLAHLDPRLAELVDYRFFGGFSEPEIGQLMGISERTVRREWAKARALLFEWMQTDPGTCAEL